MAHGTKPMRESNGSQIRFNMAKGVEQQRRKRVLVVGAGAAGLSGVTICPSNHADPHIQACHVPTTSLSTRISLT